MKSFLCLAALFGPSAVATAVDFVSATVDAVPRANAAQLMMNRHVNSTDPTKNLKRGPSLEELEQQREERIERTRERRELARQKIANLQPDLSQLEFVTKEELDSLDADEHPWIRRAGWRNDWNSAYVLNVADPSLSYDRWAQAYRMLGGFIDCDHQKSQRGGGKNDNKNNNNNQEQGSGCSRWMMWAAVSTIHHSEIRQNGTFQPSITILELLFTALDLSWLWISWKLGPHYCSHYLPPFILTVRRS